MGLKARRQFAAAHQSASPERFTPPHIVELARRVMGSIELDPASCKKANEYVQAKRYYTAAEDGLTKPWKARTVFLNPPSEVAGGRPGDGPKLFWKKLVLDYLAGEFEQGIYLGFSLEQLLSLQKVEDCLTPFEFPICFARTRIKFLDQRGRPMTRPSHGNFFCYLGGEFQRFLEVFSDLGRCSMPMIHWYVPMAQRMLV